MKKRMSSIIPQAVGACALITAASTQAFLEDSSFYLVPSVGYHYTDVIDHYEKVEKLLGDGLKIDFDDAAVYGISFGFQTNAYSAIEFAYNYTQFDLSAKWNAPNLDGKTSAKYDINHHYVHVDALYYFSNIYENDFSFYIPVGIGYAKYDSDKVGKGIEDTVFNFGVGLQYMFGEHFGLRGDVRGLYGFSQKNFDAIAQVGAVFRFGVPVPVGMADDNIIKTANIRFKLNSTQAVNADDPDIAALAEAVKNNPNANIKIMAYSSNSGTSAYNMKLSQRRAESLKNILMNKYGVAESRIYTKAFGDQQGMSRSRHAVAVVEY